MQHQGHILESHAVSQRTPCMDCRSDGFPSRVPWSQLPRPTDSSAHWCYCMANAQMQPAPTQMAQYLKLKPRQPLIFPFLFVAFG